MMISFVRHICNCLHVGCNLSLDLHNCGRLFWFLLVYHVELRRRAVIPSFAFGLVRAGSLSGALSIKYSLPQ